MSDLKFKNFQNTLLKNSENVDNFIKTNLPSSKGLNEKLIKAINYSILGSGKKIRSFLFKPSFLGKFFFIKESTSSLFLNNVFWKFLNFKFTHLNFV